jgi:hypothetical protein
MKVNPDQPLSPACGKARRGPRLDLSIAAFLSAFASGRLMSTSRSYAMVFDEGRAA